MCDLRGLVRGEEYPVSFKKRRKYKLTLGNSMNHGKAMAVRAWPHQHSYYRQVVLKWLSNTHEYLWIMLKYLFLHAPKQRCPNHLFGCRSFTAPEWLLLSPLPLHSFDWQMGGKMVDGEWAGGQSWDCVSQCVRARSTTCRLSRWDGKGRWDVAGPYLKASLQCPLNQRSLMVHHRHVIPC